MHKSKVKYIILILFEIFFYFKYIIIREKHFQSIIKLFSLIFLGNILLSVVEAKYLFSCYFLK